MNELAARAAAGLRSRSNSHYAGCAIMLDNAAPKGAEALAACLDLTPLARRSIERLPEWLGRHTDERTASTRLAFRDAVEVAEDAGPRLLEILHGHMEEPWLVLRLISALMHRPADQYVANSELAIFGDRLLDDIEAQLQTLATFQIDGGSEAAMIASAAVRCAALQIAEFDEAVELSKDGPWGSRIARYRRSLAQAVEGRLKTVELEVAKALPLQSPAGKSRGGPRGMPRLTQEPDPRQCRRVEALLTFMHEVRMLADRIGSGSMWAKTSEAVHGRLDAYVEDLLDKLRAADPADDLDRVRVYLDIAANFLGVASDEQAAQIVRRRVAAA